MKSNMEMNEKSVPPAALSGTLPGAKLLKSLINGWRFARGGCGRFVRFSLFVGLISLSLISAAQASEPARDFLDGVRAYQENRYEEAISHFKRITDAGTVNGQLFYNLGNAHFKAGDTGRAILWYNRALKLIPNDPDLTFNHDYASGLVKDKSEETSSPLIGILFFWKKLLPKTVIQWAGIGFFALFWIITALRMAGYEKYFKISRTVILVLALIFITTSLVDYYNDAYTKEAVILSSEVSVRSGLSEDSTELFILHEGTRVSVEEVRPEHVKIRFSWNKIGWLKKNDAEII